MKEKAGQRIEKVVYAQTAEKILFLAMKKTCPECRAKACGLAEKNRSGAKKKKYNDYMKQYQKELYADRKRTGICTRCGKRKADTGYYTCGLCRKNAREAKKCGEKKEKREERVNNGYCYFCKEKALKGLKVCGKHYVHMVYMAALPQTKEARDRSRKTGMLY